MTLLTWGVFMSLSVSPAAPPSVTAPTGAAAIFVSQEPRLRDARQLLAEGKFKEAESLLKEGSASGNGSGLQDSLDGLEIIRRMRQDYSVSEQALLQKLASSLPNVTAKDVRKWREAGQLQARTIDGEVLYFRREPSNLFRFCPEAIEQRKAAGKAPKDSDAQVEHLGPYLKKVIAAAQAGDSPIVMPVRHQVTYKVTVQPNRPGAKAGSLVRCWLPLPQEYRQQSQVRLIRTDPADPQITPVGISGDQINRNAQRAVYLERKLEKPDAAVTFEEQFEYVCASYYPQLSDEKAQLLSRTDLGAYLAERPPHILFSSEIKAAVAEAVGDEKNPLAKVRRIYYWIDKHTRYCAEEEYTNIPSFSQKVITSRKGDCGILSTLFITMCRAAGIPARWQSGWETKPWGFNMHDWAEFYMEPWGWLPADMSYGLQPSKDPAIREFYIGHLESYRMIVNLDYGCPLVPEKKSLRSEPADFQRGEVEIDGRNLYFDEWDYDIQFKWDPAP